MIIDSLDHFECYQKLHPLFKEVAKFLKENNLEYWWVYPKKELKEEYMERCRKRGNNNEFISWYSKLWNEWIDKCKNDKNASRHIELKSNQFLEDVLPNLKK